MGEFDNIEITARVKLDASVTFWIERGKWDAMTYDERQRTLVKAASEIQRQMNNCPFQAFGLSLDPSLYVSISEIWPYFDVYDPASDG